MQQLPPTYHEHAVRAFDIHAVDYLTKPINAERLATALERVRKKIAAETALLTQEQLTAVLNGLRLGEVSNYPSRSWLKMGKKRSCLRPRRLTGSKQRTTTAVCMWVVGATCCVKPSPSSDGSRHSDFRQGFLL